MALLDQHSKSLTVEVTIKTVYNMHSGVSRLTQLQLACASLGQEVFSRVS